MGKMVHKGLGYKTIRGLGKGLELGIRFRG